MRSMNTLFSKRLVVAVLLIVLGVGGRIVLWDVPNIETIMLVSILAGALLGGRWGIIVALAAVAASDAFKGNTSIMWFTWSAWAVVGLGGALLRRSNKASWMFALKTTGLGVVGAIFFFLWTNFGVWATGWLYPLTAEGLVQSYVMGLPFLRMHLVSCLTVVPAGTLLFVLLYRFMYVRHLVPLFASQGIYHTGSKR